MNALWILNMVWRDVCMAHWRADGAKLEALLPPGLTLDRYDGEAWLSIVPFWMSDVRPRGLPAFPAFNPVSEMNVRTYVRAGELSGIYFFSLDADRPLLVRAARFATGLRYLDARIALAAGVDTITYVSERTHRDAPPARIHARYRRSAPGVAARAGSLEAFLHERYHFFSVHRGRLVSGEVRHRPWTLAPTEMEIEENAMGEQIGHPFLGAPDYCFFTDRLDVRAYPLRPISERS